MKPIIFFNLLCFLSISFVSQAQTFNELAEKANQAMWYDNDYAQASKYYEEAFLHSSENNKLNVEIKSNVSFLVILFWLIF